jgi:hypothetical protein
MAFSIIGRISSAHAADPNLPGTDAPAAELAKLYNAANAADITYQTAKAKVTEADTKLFFDSSSIVQTTALSARAQRVVALATATAASDQLRAFAARTPLTEGASDSIVESALLTFIADFRTSLGRFRPSPKFNTNCPDFVTSGLLLDIANSVIKNDRGLYAAALGKAEAALQCVRLSEVLGINEALAMSFDTTLARFSENAKPIARRGLMSAFLNLFLLVHDDTKIVGPTPLYNWFVNNRVPLGAVLLQPNSVPRLTGLWLRHPSSDQLIQIRSLCEDPASGSDCVSGGHLLDALTDPWRIGVGACTALEVVSAGLDSSEGYFCDRGLCRVENDTLVPSLDSPLLQRLFGRNGGTTQFSVDLPTLQNARCSGSPGRVGGVGGGGMIGGNSGPPDFFACLSSGIAATSARKTSQCVIDATLKNAATQPADGRRGWASDPCTRAAGDAGGGTEPEPGCTEDCGEDPKDKQTPEQKPIITQTVEDVTLNPTFREQVAQYAEANSYGTLTDASYDAAVFELSNAKFGSQAVLDAAAPFNLPGTTRGATRFEFEDPGTGVGKAEITILEGMSPSDTEDILIHEFVHAVLNHMLNARATSDIEDEAGRQHNIICNGLGLPGCGSKQCGPESDTCGSCASSSIMASDILSCFPSQSLPPITRPNGGVIDPSPIEDPASSSWGTCFAGDMLSVPPSCLALDCSEDSGPVLVNGHCQCSSPGGGPIMPPIARCGFVDCVDGPPIFPGCLCMPYGGPSIGKPISGCPLCIRGVDPLLNQCVQQPQACFFQNPVTRF